VHWKIGRVSRGATRRSCCCLLLGIFVGVPTAANMPSYTYELHTVTFCSYICTASRLGAPTRRAAFYLRASTTSPWSARLASPGGGFAHWLAVSCLLAGASNYVSVKGAHQAASLPVRARGSPRPPSFATAKFASCGSPVRPGRTSGPRSQLAMRIELNISAPKRCYSRRTIDRPRLCTSCATANRNRYAGGIMPVRIRRVGDSTPRGTVAKPRYPR